MRQRSGFSRTDMADQSSLVALQRLGLPEGMTLKEYRRQVEVGMAAAALHFAKQRMLTELTLEKIGGVHRETFKVVHPRWAGNFRKEGQAIQFGIDKAAPSRKTEDPARLRGASSARIVPELSLTIKQVEWILGRRLRDTRLGEDLAPAAAIAHCHIRFTRIHPFLDGNGRSGRIILTSQVKEASGEDLVLTNRKAYITALRHADDGLLTPLINLIRDGRTPTTVEVRSPFRIAHLSARDLLAMGDLDLQFENSFLE